MKMQTKITKMFIIAFCFICCFGNVALAVGPQKQVPSGLAVQDIESNIDIIMDKYIGKTVPGASIVVVKDDEIVFSKGYGYADIDKKIPMDAQTTILEPGSVSKLFTWTSVMQLVEQGKIDLNADVSTYLPEGFMDRSFSDKVTMIDLMNHVAGYEEHAEGMMLENPDQLLTLEDYLSTGTQPKQVYRPRTTLSYSNYSTNIAGYIVERVSGMKFQDYVQANIFEPLEMTPATFDNHYNTMPAITQDKAVGYLVNDGIFTALPPLYISDMPAGSLNTTAQNMGHFMMAQLNYSGQGQYSLFSSPETLKEMQTNTFQYDENMPGNAHGFWENISTDKRALEHGGNTQGFTSRLLLVPEDNFGVCILTNAGSEMSGAIYEAIYTLLGEESFATKPMVSESHVDEVVGIYATTRTFRSNIMSIINIVNLAPSNSFVVRNNNQGGIDVSVAAMNINMSFVEVEPYYFQRVDTEANAWDKAGMETTKLYFVQDENGNVDQLSYGIISTNSKLSVWSNPTMHQIVLGGIAFITLVGLIWSSVIWIKNRKNSNKSILKLTKMNFLSSTLMLLSLGNAALTFIRVVTDPMAKVQNLQIHVILCWMLSLILIANIIRSFISEFKKITPKSSKILTILLAIASILLTLILIHYNFFVFV